jgi:excisionase family DNA binding protein
MTERLLKIDEAAERLGMRPFTIRKWLRQGKLRGVKTAPHQRGKWRVPESAVVEFVAEMPNNREAATNAA